MEKNQPLVWKKRDTVYSKNQTLQPIKFLVRRLKREINLLKPIKKFLEVENCRSRNR